MSYYRRTAARTAAPHSPQSPGYSPSAAALTSTTKGTEGVGFGVIGGPGRDVSLGERVACRDYPVVA